MQHRAIRPYFSKQQSGFTLIELVTVIVILAIIAVIGSSFIARSAESYQQTASRSQLVHQSRQAIERINRELRHAVPNSLRTDTNGRCIEWLPIVAGVHYLTSLPDQINGASALSSIETAAIPPDVVAPYLTVGALHSHEVYGSNPVSMAAVSGLQPSAITLDGPKTFQRNSNSRRLFLASYPKQICVSNDGSLTLHDNYVLSGFPPITLVAAEGGVLLAKDVGSSTRPFVIEAGSQARNTILNIDLSFSKNGERIVLEHQVMVRNVP